MVAREVDSWKAHIAGLDRILALRGGLDSLNSNDYVKHKVRGQAPVPRPSYQHTLIPLQVPALLAVQADVPWDCS